jgi:hypothetical protein
MAFKRLGPVFQLITLTLCSLLSILSFGNSASGSGAIGVPSYVYPCFDTSDVCAWYVFKRGATIVIINPNSGPGTFQDPEFVQLIATLKENSTVTTLLGYVSTSYGNKDPSSVLADIDAYYVNYTNIDGIFLDEGSTDCGATDLASYKSYDDRVKTHWGSSGFTALNWGTTGSECYLNGTNIDLYCTFEESYNNYVNAYPANPSWISNYNASRFWHIVHSTPVNASSVQAAVSLSQTRHAGYYYFTDAIYIPNTAFNNPYNVSPSQTVWNAELSN